MSKLLSICFFLSVLAFFPYSKINAVNFELSVFKVITNDSTPDKENHVQVEVNNGEIIHLNINGKEIPKSEYGKYKEYTEGGNFDVNVKSGKKKIIIKKRNSPESNIDIAMNDEKELGDLSALNENVKIIKRHGGRSLIITSDDMMAPIPPMPPIPPVPPVPPMKPFHFNFKNNNGFKYKYKYRTNGSDENCNPCNEERAELKEELKDVIVELSNFDTEDSRDMTFYNTKATEIKEIKRKLSDTTIKGDDIEKLRTQMQKIREEMEDFDDSGDLYPNRKTKYGWQAGFEQELLKDGLIKDVKHYSVRMENENDEIVINDETKSHEVFLKYKRLYEQLTGSKLRRAKEIEYRKE